MAYVVLGSLALGILKLQKSQTRLFNSAEVALTEISSNTELKKSL